MLPKYKNKKIVCIYLIFINSILFLGIIFSLNLFPTSSTVPNFSPHSSGIWATLDLDDAGFNGTRIPHDTLIMIQGRLFNRVTGDNKSGYTVALEIDDIIDSSYNDVTDSNGRFQINYLVDVSLGLYTSHKIEAIVIDTTPDTVEYRTYYEININITSYFDIIGTPTPQLGGELFNPNGYIRMADGSGIPFTSVNYQWYDGPVMIDNNFVATDDSGLIQDIATPDIGVDNLDLFLSYASPPEIGSSNMLIPNIRIFFNISCIWNLPSPIRASSDLTIAGRLISLTNPSLRLSYKTIQIYFNGTYVDELQTDGNGDFSLNYRLPSSYGPSQITINFPNSIGKTITTTYFFDVQPPSTSITPGPGVPPFLMFSSIFFPILGAVIGVLAFYGYRYYKKQEKASKVVKLPLEDKIKNLKMLKETGRLEESLSYLFNAIYMELINAKYGRTRNENETIRDFAIVSVKNLKLSPTTIYPFIQKVEEIIYAKPYQINENDFYNTINLFSPIYFELTGYNFILSF